MALHLPRLSSNRAEEKNFKMLTTLTMQLFLLLVSTSRLCASLALAPRPAPVECLFKRQACPADCPALLDQYGCPICSSDCPIVNGNWGSWGPWGTCSVTCGGGTMARSRSCNNPTPSNGGLPCVGSSYESSSCNTQACNGADVTIDLTTGSISPSNAVSSANGFAWQSTLTSSSQPCSNQGVLKLTFNTSTRKRAEINMLFQNSNGFSFNVGDSVTNNGYGGDGATQDSDAEVHSLNTQIFFYGKGIPGAYAQWYGLLYSRDNFITSNVTLNVADELVTADNGNDFIYINTYKTFALNGQADTEGPINYDVYLGMNRVVAGGRTGTGLCKVSIKWYAS